VKKAQAADYMVAAVVLEHGYWLWDFSGSHVLHIGLAHFLCWYLLGRFMLLGNKRNPA
jgi:hypothetical protein